MVTTTDITADARDIAQGIATAALWADGVQAVPDHDCPWKRTNPAPLGAPFCSVCDEHQEQETGGLEHLDMDDESMLKLKRIALLFMDRFREEIQTYIEWRENGRGQALSGEGNAYEHVGHDLYLTAAHHGVGFTDRFDHNDEGGQALADALKSGARSAPFSSLEHAMPYQVQPFGIVASFDMLPDVELSTPPNVTLGYN